MNNNKTLSPVAQCRAFFARCASAVFSSAAFPSLATLRRTAPTKALHAILLFATVTLGVPAQAQPTLPPQANPRAQQQVQANPQPAVQWIAPASGTVFQTTGATATITLQAAATPSNPARPVTSLTFYANGQSLGSIANPAAGQSVSLVWNAAPGVYQISATATDSQNRQGSSPAVSLTVNANQTPQVSLAPLTGPINGNYIAPASITLSATASDTDGTIQSVGFYNGSTLIGQGTLASGTTANGTYSFTWSNVAQGSYVITARATDNSNATTISASQSVTVQAALAANQAPTVSVTAPANNQSYIAGASGTSITLTANVSDADGTVTSVNFYNGQTLIGQATLSSGTTSNGTYSFTWNNVTPGSYSLTARATDGGGNGTTTTGSPATTTSAAANITVSANQAPAVTLAPLNGPYTAPATITLNATASDADGTIQSVSFYNGSTLLGQGTLASGTAANGSYSFTWSNVPQGSYAITARAIDTLNAITTSASQSIIVQPALIANQAPTVSLTAPANNQSYITGPAGSGAGLSITLTATGSDADGTVQSVSFYNGSTLIGQGTLSSGTNTNGTYTFAWNNVAASSYSITARVTDSGGNNTTTTGSPATTTSAAISINVVAGQAPTITLNSPVAPGGGFTAPASITLTANASDADGTVQSVAFYNGATLIGQGVLISGTANSGTYSFSWSNVAAGNYTVTARATDNQSFVTASNSIPIAVTTPVVNVTTPGLFFIEVDHLATPRLISNQAQQVVWANPNAEPFGDSTPNENPSGLGVFEHNTGFPGQYRDKETGLAYNYFRTYRPAEGSYTTSDPIGLSGGINTYAYVNGSPLMFTDSQGLFSVGGHINMTWDALGQCPALRNKLPEMVGAVDRLPGSQLPANSRWHYMAEPGTPANEATKQAEEHIRTQIDSCSLEGLAKAIHAGQDKHSKAHGGSEEWSGVAKTPWWKLVWHGIVDTSEIGRSDAVAETRKILDQFSRKCACICR